MPIILPIENTGEVSDGYHTFDELYEHRCYLFANLMKCYPEKAFKAWKHHDGSFLDGWFLAGIHTPDGDITYHLPGTMWDELEGIKEMDRGPEWDGHTSQDVIKRLKQLLKIYL